MMGLQRCAESATHVTRGACAGSSSSRRSLAVIFPRLLVEGSDVSERADLLTIGYHRHLAPT